MFVLEAIRDYAKTGRVALINREERLTFSELDARSEAFAAYLLKKFGDDRTPILIYGQKETDFLSCIFGALKSGRGYVPIDRTVPADRAAQIAEDIKPQVVVDFGGFTAETEGEILTPQDLNKIFSGGGQVSPSYWISGNTPAYILFTSGSTGKPKGVPITVNNLAAFYRGILPQYPAEEGGIILHQISYSFDVSGCSLYVGLSRGMTLFTVDHGMLEDMGQLFSALGQSELTFWVSTPSFGELCVQSGRFTEELLPRLKNFLFCGEVLTHTLCDTLAQRFPKARVLNTYGPTEATVLVTAAEVTEEMRRDSRPIPIGQPIPGTRLLLVDQAGRPVEEDEEPGELYILGPSVGPGYLERPDLTEKAFFTDTATGLRGYRTGDICYRRRGVYYYCGRADNQLKLNGFRIEIEDVENNLQKLSNVARAAVVPVWEGEKVQYLAAFLLLKEPDGLTPLKRSIQLKKEAAQYLPGYMIPRRILTVDAFPLNVNGKVDKKALACQLKGAKA